MAAMPGTSITKDTKTDVINKVLQLYNEVRAAQEADGGIWIQADKGSEAVKLRRRWRF